MLGCTTSYLEVALTVTLFLLLIEKIRNNVDIRNPLFSDL